MPSSRQIRQQFIDFFVQQHAHHVVPSSPVLPHDDPTLLFTNAGMNQFKQVFLGTATPPFDRIVNTQKCIRAGGKHNDLEDVGKDSYHHTFFEMLGNWSFGDYFKREAIAWGWDLLTNVWGLPKDRLFVTVFAGDDQQGVPPDDESADLWLEATDLDPSQISRWGVKDNFWEMGDTGPCGVNSEVHIDRTPDGSGSELVNRDDPRVVELWNLVFIQYNRNAQGTLAPLPAKHVDTGMGFERICSVLQDVESNYDTDLFTPIFETIRDLTGSRPYGRSLDDPSDIAYRVIADHLRCLVFAITDGALPSNEGRGYVLRRILRRAVRHGWQTLEMTEPFLYRLIPAVVDTMSDIFPELNKNPDLVMQVIQDEEQSFDKTLDRGIAMFNQAAKRGCEISGNDAFKLHDTFGFPVDLTQVMAHERGIPVDVDGFNLLMEKARDLARGRDGAADLMSSLIDIVQRDHLGPTQSLAYTATDAKLTTFCHVYCLGEAGYAASESVDAGNQVALVVGQSPFYAEAGGQVGDTGIIQIGNAHIHVTNTVRIGDVFFHIGHVAEGQVTSSANARVTMQVDAERRSRIRANHSATHMMNRALRVHVNPNADQKGSLVDDEKLRFDFSHSVALTTDQIDLVQQAVNHDVTANLSVYDGYAHLEQGQKIRGLRAVFGEKYPTNVRIVSIGVPIEKLLTDPENDQWSNYSIEFCGGTHLAKTGDAKGFVVIGEEAIGKGLRRLTALTGESAHRISAQGAMMLKRLESLREGPVEQLSEAVPGISREMDGAMLPALDRARLMAGIATCQKVLRRHQKRQNRQATGDVVEEARHIAEQSGEDLIVVRVEGADARTLRTAMDVIRKKKPGAALLLSAVTDKKLAFVASVPKAMIDRGLKAGDWVRRVAEVTGGGGGGRPDMAQAGGKEPGKLDEALEVGRQFAAKKLGE